MGGGNAYVPHIPQPSGSSTGRAVCRIRRCPGCRDNGVWDHPECGCRPRTPHAQSEGGQNRGAASAGRAAGWLEERRRRGSQVVWAESHDDSQAGRSTAARNRRCAAAATTGWDATITVILLSTPAGGQPEVATVPHGDVTWLPTILTFAFAMGDSCNLWLSPC